jgi:hypothetical protein
MHVPEVKSDEKIKCRNIVLLQHRTSLVCIGMIKSLKNDEKEATNVTETVHFYFTDMKCHVYMHNVGQNSK